ncbi:MAG: cupin domain-containing protein [Chloroflexi bacterium]|nr:cupin domain-containing protein [Chloroflexota bacterium]
MTSIPSFTAPDGACVQELAGRSNGFTSHSLAVIVHPPGTAATEHHHTVADEVYLVSSGRGRIRVDEVTREVGPGDVVLIRPGQRHKVWNDGPDDLALVVTCAPAYDVGEVVWDE